MKGEQEKYRQWIRFAAVLVALHCRPALLRPGYCVAVLWPIARWRASYARTPSTIVRHVRDYSEERSFDDKTGFERRSPFPFPLPSWCTRIGKGRKVMFVKLAVGTFVTLTLLGMGERERSQELTPLTYLDLRDERLIASQFLLSEDYLLLKDKYLNRSSCKTI